MSPDPKVSKTLNCMDEKPCICFAESQFGNYSMSDIAGNIRSKGGTHGGGSETLLYFANQHFGAYKSDNVASTLKHRDYKDATDLVVT